MTEKTIIRIDEQHGAFILKLTMEGESQWFEVDITDAKPKVVFDFLFNWIMLKLRPLFDEMPLDRINFVSDGKMREKYKTLILWVISLLEATNSTIRQYRNLGAFAADFDGTLFFNVSEDLRYKSLYNLLSKGRDIKYRNLALNYDRVNRKWKESGVPMELPELIEYFQAIKIKRVITVNYYVIDKYIEKTGVNLLPLIERFGMEWITIDNDPPDLRPQGYTHKAWLNNNDWVRFANLSVLSRHWDEHYNLSNVKYIAIPQNYEKNGRPPRVLPDDYRIVVLSNSRVEGINSMRKAIESIVEHIEKTGDLYRDIQLYYMAMRYMILNIMELSEFKRLWYNSVLHNFYFNTVNYMKHRIVQGLETDREVMVYGDVGWQEICPQYYKGSLNNEEINDLFNEKNNLYLLLNFSLTYLDCSAPVYDMIRRDVPWVNVPPLARTSILKGFRGLEYSNLTELNDLVNNGRERWAGEHVRDAIGRYRAMLVDSTDTIGERIFDNNVPEDGVWKNGGVWAGHLHEHQALLDRKVEKYFEEKEPFLRESFGMFL